MRHRTAALTSAVVLTIVLACSEHGPGPTEPNASVGPARPPAPSPVTTAASATSGTAPAPGAGDRLLLDTRGSLQRAGTLDEALRLFTASAGQRWAFTTDMDGRGTHALRVDWPRRAGTACGAASVSVAALLPEPYPTELYVQWKQHMGRTATGGGVGDVGSFGLVNQRCRHGEREGLLRMQRATTRNHWQPRLELDWEADSAVVPQVEVGEGRSAFGANQGWDWDPRTAVGSDVVQTLYFRAESAPRAGDGVIRYWVDGRLLIEQTNVAMGAAAFRRMVMPNLFRAPPQAQSEYFWDLVAWEPGAAPTPPALQSLVLTPDSARLAPGGTQQFQVAGRFSNDSAGPVTATYTATGGSITPEGLYTAGQTPGAYQVIATSTPAGGSPVADTSRVVITAPAAPTLTAITLSPDTARLASGATQQFQVTGRWSNDSTSTVAATYSATGGSITQQGRYTAGATAGTFRVIASYTPSGGSPLADTSTVVITVTRALTGVVLTPAAATLAPGGTQQFQTTGRWNNDSTAPVAATYSATGGTITTAGLYTAGQSAGSYRVIATYAPASGGSFADTSTITITAPPPPPPPPTGSSVALVVQRLAAGTGTTLVSSGIPLPPGRLTASQVALVRLFVNGVEQSVYVEPLAGTHRDGSLRAVLVQFNYALNGTTPVTGRLDFGQARGVADLPKPTADRGSPAAVVLPSDPAYLVTTDINGPTITAASTRALGGAFAQYESDFATYADQHWTQEGANWAAADYYDRALIYYAWWARTGNVEYWRRATLLALDYRRNYLEANNYASSPHWSQLEGLAQHYLATGDERSRTAVAETADRLYQGFDATLGSDQWENRIQARVLQAYLIAWRLGATGSTPHDWGALLDAGLTKVLGTQGSDGAYRFPVTCGQSLNYMTGLLNDVYIKYYTYYRADSRIPTAVKRSIDYMWGSQWVPSAQAFKYYSAPCGGDPDTPAPDLNNLIVTGYSWYAQLTHDATYRSDADAIFAGGVAGAYLDGSKQFNENYSASFRHLAYRNW